MRPDVTVVRSARDRALPRGVFAPVEYSRHAPRKRFRVLLKDPSSVRIAARFGVPVSLLEPSLARKLGYPVEFPPRLLVGRPYAGAVDSPYPKIVFSNSEAAHKPRPEDVVVAMLFFDWLGARRMVRNGRLNMDLHYLRSRVTEEHLEVRASRVRLDDFVPGLPRFGQPLSREDLRELDSKVFERPAKHER